MSNLLPGIQYIPNLFYREEETKTLLAEAGLLEQGELQELLKKYPKNESIKLAHARTYYNEDNPHYEELILDIYNEFPDSIPSKLELIEHFHNDYTNPDNQNKIKQILQKEIDAILNNKPYEKVIGDHQYLSLLFQLLHIYVYENNNEAIRIVYNKFTEFGQRELIFNAASIIIGKETPMLLDDNFSPSAWTEDLETTLEKNRNLLPKYDIMLYLLKTHIYDLDEDILLRISKLENKEYISHDIRWLLYQSFVRYKKSGFDIQPDTLILSIYLIAHFGLVQDIPLLYTIMADMSDDNYDDIFGDIDLSILILPLGDIIALSTEGLYSFLTNNHIDHRPRSIWVHSLCYQYDRSGDAALLDILDQLYIHYREADPDLVGDLVYAQQEFRIASYAEKMQYVYDNNKINKRIFGEEPEFSTSKSTFLDKDKFKVDHTLLGYYSVFKNSLLDSDVTPHTGTIQEIAQDYYDNSDQSKNYMDNPFAHMHPSEIWDDYDEMDDYVYQEPYVRTEEKINRNDPCPCDSGKKYKKCCWKRDI